MAEVHITNNFYGSVGQQIDHIDHQEVHFDKDMQMQVANTPAAEEGGDSTPAGLATTINNPKQLLPQGGDAQSALCTYIIPNDIKPMEEIEKEMAAAARKSAPALVNYIKQALRLGYIDLRGDNSKVVYETLRDHFGLTYSYNNWTKYYS